uniref:Ribosomal protein S2 n=1 Tax=Paraurostyla sp. TaxID=6014 RepID=A0A3S6K1Z6_9STIC|nr:ribosomal protein S2 [Paraurostyla sp.]
MNSSWLLKKSSNNFYHLLQNLIFFFLLQKFNFFFFNNFANNFFFFLKKNFNFFKNNFFNNNFFNNIFDKNFNNKWHLEYNNIFNDKNSHSFSLQKNYTNYNNFFLKNKIKHFSLIYLLMFFNVKSTTSDAKPAHYINMFYLFYKKGNIYVINVPRFISRLNDSISLCSSIFFYDCSLLIFSNALCKNLTLSLNWNFNNWDIKIWKYYFPFFVYKFKKNSPFVDFFFSNLRDLNFETFVLTDVLNHYKNLLYFSKHYYFTIGLTPSTVNPFIVSYPILIFHTSYQIQLFFLKLLNYLNNQNLLYKFLFFKKIWINFFLKNKIKF